jgi:hypothetical protein
LKGNQSQIAIGGIQKDLKADKTLCGEADHLFMPAADSWKLGRDYGTQQSQMRP